MTGNKDKFRKHSSKQSTKNIIKSIINNSSLCPNRQPEANDNLEDSRYNIAHRYAVRNSWDDKMENI